MALEDELGGGGASPKAHKSGGNLLVIIIGLVVMIVAPASSYLVVKLNQPETEMSAPPENELTEAPVMFTLKSLVVNVAETRMTRVLRLEPHLILSDVALEEYMKKIEPLIKDRIMAIASQRTLEELESKEDREALKRDIVNNINELIRDRMQGSVLDVVFSDFLIQ